MPGMVFGFSMTIVTLGAVVLMLLIIVQGQSRAAKRRHDAFKQALDAGVYDRSLIEQKKSRHAMLGWGIFFVGVGLAVLISLGAASDPNALSDGLAGAMVPMFIGIALIVFYSLVRKFSSESGDANGRPVVFDRENGGEPPSIKSSGE